MKADKYRAAPATTTPTLGRRAFSAGLLVAPWAVSGCGGEDAPEAVDTVRLGVMAPESSPSLARRLLAIGQMACREINAAGGLTLDGKSRTVEAVLIPFANSVGDDAVPRMQAEGTRFVVGPVGSSQMLGENGDGKGAAGLAARDAGIILISGSATNPDISKLGLDGYFWRTVPPDDLQAKVAVTHLRRDRKASTMGILFNEQPYSAGLAKAVAEGFTSAGGTVLQQVSFSATGKGTVDLLKYDFAAELKAVFAGNPEVIYLAVTDEAVLVGNNAVLQGFHAAYGATPPIYFSIDGAVTFDLLSGGRPEFLSHLSGTVPTPDKNGAEFQRFAAALAAEGLGEGINYESYIYDAFYIFAAALQRANSVDSALVKERIREVTLASPGSTRVGVAEWGKAKAALLAGTPVNYDGASGPIEFEPDGDPAAALYAIWKPKPKAGGGYEYDYSDVRSAETG